VIHLHGELLKVRCTYDESIILDWRDDLNLGDLSQQGHQLRPHIVWFGEAVPLLDAAISLVEAADVIIIVGTSMQVYPAAGLIQYATYDSKIYFVDPNPSISSSERITVFAENATTGVLKVIADLENK
jgi:NAD-dependent deacetylase